MTEHLQDSRFELKYLISEECAHAICGYVQPYLAHDTHAQPQHGFSYPVQSVYLDSPDLALCQATLDGLRHRYKLRVRSYGQSPEGPVFFEIKRRVDQILQKSRVAVRWESLPRLLARKEPRPADLWEDAGAETLRRFCDLCAGIDGRAQIIVSYMREAYVMSDSSFRLTFDRQLSVRRVGAEQPFANGQRAFHVRVGGVILELKFTNRFPQWAADMVQLFSLERRPFPKYVTCVQTLATPDYRMMHLAQRSSI